MEASLGRAVHEESRYTRLLALDCQLNYSLRISRTGLLALTSVYGSPNDRGLVVALQDLRRCDAIGCCDVAEGDQKKSEAFSDEELIKLYPVRIEFESLFQNVVSLSLSFSADGNIAMLGGSSHAGEEYTVCVGARTSLLPLFWSLHIFDSNFVPLALTGAPVRA